MSAGLQGNQSASCEGGIYRNHREERQWEIDDLKGDLPNQSAAEGKDIV